MITDDATIRWLWSAGSLQDRRSRGRTRMLEAGKPFLELRGSHFRMIPPEGARSGALAAIAQVTRPALGELVRHLEEHGYVEVIGEESDRRAVRPAHCTRPRSSRRSRGEDRRA